MLAAASLAIALALPLLPRLATRVSAVGPEPAAAPAARPAADLDAPVEPALPSVRGVERAAVSGNGEDTAVGSPGADTRIAGHVVIEEADGVRTPFEGDGTMRLFQAQDGSHRGPVTVAIDAGRWILPWNPPRTVHGRQEAKREPSAGADPTTDEVAGPVLVVTALRLAGRPAFAPTPTLQGTPGTDVEVVAHVLTPTRLRLLDAESGAELRSGVELVLREPTFERVTAERQAVQRSLGHQQASGTIQISTDAFEIGLPPSVQSAPPRGSEAAAERVLFPLDYCPEDVGGETVWLRPDGYEWTCWEPTMLAAAEVELRVLPAGTLKLALAEPGGAVPRGTVRIYELGSQTPAYAVEIEPGESDTVVLRAGEYVATYECDPGRRELDSQHVFVPAGGEASCVLRPVASPATPPTGVVHGRVLAGAGAAGLLAERIERVTLLALEPHIVRWDSGRPTRLQGRLLDPDGSGEVRWVAEGVPPGAWAVELEPLEYSEPILVESGDNEVVLRLESLRGRMIHLVDSGTGEPVSGASASWRIAPSHGSLPASAFGPTVPYRPCGSNLELVAPDGVIVLSVTAPGYTYRQDRIQLGPEMDESTVALDPTHVIDIVVPSAGSGFDSGRWRSGFAHTDGGRVLPLQMSSWSDGSELRTRLVFPTAEPLRLTLPTGWSLPDGARSTVVSPARAPRGSSGTLPPTAVLAVHRE